MPVREKTKLLCNYKNQSLHILKSFSCERVTHYCSEWVVIFLPPIEYAQFKTIFSFKEVILVNHDRQVIATHKISMG